jgi:hypothetical protein
MRYDPKTRLSVEELSKQYFLTRDPSTFHNYQLKQNKKDNMDLAKSITINSKEDKNNGANLWEIYESDIDLTGCDPEETADQKSICQPGNRKKIKDEPTDVVGTELENQMRDNAYKRGDKNDIANNQEKRNNSKSDYLNNCFDEMNKDCFYIEPLLIPTQPFDSYNSEDPIS